MSRVAERWIVRRHLLGRRDGTSGVTRRGLASVSLTSPVESAVTTMPVDRKSRRARISAVQRVSALRDRTSRGRRGECALRISDRGQGVLISYGERLIDHTLRLPRYVDSHPARSQAGRSPGRAARPLLLGHQPQDRQGARPHHPAVALVPGRSGDRVRPLGYLPVRSRGTDHDLYVVTRARRLVA